MHLSCRDGTCKTLAASLREGKTDAIRLLSFVADHPEAQVIEGRSQVVDGIADDQGEVVWDDMLGCDVNHSLVGIFALRDSQFERVCRQEVGDLPVNVIDVVFSPV